MNNKDATILSDQISFLYRRDVGLYSKEDVISCALNVEIQLDRLTYFSFNDLEKIQILRNRLKEREEFSFFWETSSPFSQWHNSSFISSDLFHTGILASQKDYLRSTLPSELEFSSAEQFMMYHKALIFLDRDIANRIMSTTDARKIKALGRQVKNYDEDVWKFYRGDIVYQANYLKFTQNQYLMDVLLDTIGTTLVEAAPNDKIWGIGMTENNSDAYIREKWEGQNLLGEMLTLLRIELVGFY